MQESLFTNKKNLIEKVRIHEKDNGSCKVQVFLIQKKIIHLEEHLKNFKEDKDAMLSLFRLLHKKKVFLKRIRLKNKVEHDSILMNIEKYKNISNIS